MGRAIIGLAIAGFIVAVGACATTEQNKGYLICNDLDANVTCPDNTANVVTGM